MPKDKHGHGRQTTSKDGGVRLVRYFRASDAEWQWMKDLAAEHHTTISALIREFLLTDMPTTNETPYTPNRWRRLDV